MKELLQELLNILEEKNGYFQELLSLIRKERELIVRNMTEEIEKLIAQQEELLKKTSDLELKRLEITREMAESLGIPEPELTMSRIIETCDEPLKTECKKIYGDISANLKEIEKINKVNAELVKSSLDYIDFSLKTYAKAVDINPTYGDSGKVQSTLPEHKGLDESA